MVIFFQRHGKRSSRPPRANEIPSLQTQSRYRHTFLVSQECACNEYLLYILSWQGKGLSCRCCYRGEVGSEDAGHGYLQYILPASAIVLCRRTYVPVPTCAWAFLAQSTAPIFAESVLLLKCVRGYCALERNGRLTCAA